MEKTGTQARKGHCKGYFDLGIKPWENSTYQLNKNCRGVPGST